MSKVLVGLKKLNIPSEYDWHCVIKLSPSNLVVNCAAPLRDNSPNTGSESFYVDTRTGVCLLFNHWVIKVLVFTKTCFLDFFVQKLISKIFTEITKVAYVIQQTSTKPFKFENYFGLSISCGVGTYFSVKPLAQRKTRG